MDDEKESAGYWYLFSGKGNSNANSWFNEENPLLEEIIIALSRSNHPGGKIDRIADLVKRLKRTTQGKDIIPPEFETFWDLLLIAQSSLR